MQFLSSFHCLNEHTHFLFVCFSYLYRLLLCSHIEFRDCIRKFMKFRSARIWLGANCAVWFSTVHTYYCYWPHFSNRIFSKTTNHARTSNHTHTHSHTQPYTGNIELKWNNNNNNNIKAPSMCSANLWITLWRAQSKSMKIEFECECHCYAH